MVTEADGTERRCDVVTWAGPEKAIQITTGTPPGARIRPQPRASAIDLGEVEADADGLVRLRRSDRVDRAEF